MNRISNSSSSKPLPKVREPQPELEPQRRNHAGSRYQPEARQQLETGHKTEVRYSSPNRNGKRSSRSVVELPGWSTIRSTGMLGMVVAIPTGLGMAAGVWIDTLWPNAHSWFSILAPVGFALGCLCAVFWSYVDQQN